MRARIFIRVLLPEPLRPRTPSTCPCGTSKLTSLSAQIVGCGSLGALDFWPSMPPMRSYRLDPPGRGADLV